MFNTIPEVTTDKNGLEYKKVPQLFVDGLEADGMTIDNTAAHYDKAQAHIQLLSPPLSGIFGIIYYLRDDLLEGVAIHHVDMAEFDLADMVGDIVFIKYRAEDRGKIWRFRPNITLDEIQFYPRSIYGHDNSVASQLTLGQRSWLRKNYTLLREREDVNRVLISSILPNKEKFVFRDGHKYTEHYILKSTDGKTMPENISNDVESREDLNQDIASVIVDISNGDVLIHLMNPYYYK